MTIKPLSENEMSFLLYDRNIHAIDTDRLKELFAELKTRADPSSLPGKIAVDWVHIEELFGPLVPK